MAQPGAKTAKASSRTARSVEWLIGGGIFAVLGALAVVVGIGLLVKAGFDAGWWGRVPDWTKALGIAALGAALLGLGEGVRRRIPGLAASGISAAGLGTLYAAGLAAVAAYELIGPGMGFVGLVLVSALGVGAAVRSGAVSLGVLGLVGAYLTPVVMRPEDPRPEVLPVYLVAVAALGMTLSATRARFGIVRVVVGIGTAVLGTIWMLAEGTNAWGTALIFGAVMWGMAHADLVYAAMTRGLGSPRAVLTSVSVTAWSASMSSLVLAGVDGVPAWIAVAGYAGASGALGIAFSSGLRFMVDRPRTDTERLGVVAWMQCLALAAVTVPLALQGWMAASTWMAFGVGAVVAGRWSRNTALDLYGLGVLVLATGRVLLVDVWRLTVSWTPEPVGGLVFSPWWALMLMLAGAWGAAAWALTARAEPGRRWWGDAAAGAGLLCAAAAWVHADADPMAFALLGATIATVASVAGLVWSRLAGTGVVLSATGAGVLLTVTPLALFASWGDEPSAVVAGIALGAWSAAAVWLAVLWSVVALTLRAFDQGWTRSTVTPAAGVAAVTLMIGLAHPDSVDAVTLPLVVAAAMALRVVQRRLFPASKTVAGAASASATISASSPPIAPAPAPDRSDALRAAPEPLRLDLIGLGGATLVSVLWIVGRFAPLPLAETQGWAYAVAGVLMGAMIVAGERFAKSAAGERRVLMTLAAVLGLFGSTDAVVRVTTALGLPEAAANGALSVWWALLGVAMVGLGFHRARPWVRHVGLGVVLFAALKVVVYDLAPLDTVWRALSLAVVGAAMLGVATVYNAVRRRATGPATPETPETPEAPQTPRTPDDSGDDPAPPMESGAGPSVVSPVPLATHLRGMRPGGLASGSEAARVDRGGPDDRPSERPDHA